MTHADDRSPEMIVSYYLVRKDKHIHRVIVPFFRRNDQGELLRSRIHAAGKCRLEIYRRTRGGKRVDTVVPANGGALRTFRSAT